MSKNTTPTPGSRVSDGINYPRYREKKVSKNGTIKNKKQQLIEILVAFFCIIKETNQIARICNHKCSKP